MDNLIISIFEPAGYIKLIQVLITSLIFLYTIFSFILVRQVKLLNSGLKTDAAFLFSVLSYAHLLGAITLFIFSVILI